MSTGRAVKRKRNAIEVVDAKEAVDLATAQTYAENVFLFVPNLIGKLFILVTCIPLNIWIGYTRIILAGVSLYYMSHHPRYCTIAYGVSCLLDAVDGQAARALKQTSKFGAGLDMITDR
jgi:CDP-diacylglycerol--inositol 3-phosphatidyltransferase